MNAPRNHKDLGHTFAQQEPGSTYRKVVGNMSIRGDVLYSYATPVAKIVWAPNGTRIMLVSNDSYSNSTSKQLSSLWGTMPTDCLFRVPFIGAQGGQNRRGEANEPEANLAYLVSLYTDTLEKIKKARNLDFHKGMLEHYRHNARVWAVLFDLPTPDLQVERDFERVLAERDAEKTPEAKKRAAAQRQAAREAAAKAAAEARTEEDRQRLLWAAGDRDVPRCPRPRDVLFRLQPGNSQMIETSQGARVPLKDAIRVFRVVKRCHDTGAAIEATDRNLQVGQFHVDRIESTGDFTAGCHQITWAECERFARAIGVFDSVETA